MSQKVFYRYNPATEQYERVFPDTASRFYASVRVYAVAFLIVVFIALALYYMIDSPRISPVGCTAVFFFFCARFR